MLDYRHIRALASHLAGIKRRYRAGIYTLAQLYLCYAATLRERPMPEIRTIELSPPQACGVLDPAKPGQICGKPARYATAEAAPVRACGPAGYLLVLPVCADCARFVSPAITDKLREPRLIVDVTLMLPDNPAPSQLLHAADQLEARALRMARDAQELRRRAAELARRN